MRNAFLVGIACLAVVLVAQPTLAGSVVVDFEAPTYVGQATTAGSISPPVRATAPTSLIADDLSSSQDGWYESWGNHFDVHTYEGAAVSFEETRKSVHPEGGHQQWATPPNPEGGEQFIALGCGNFLRESDPTNNPGVFDAHGNSGGSNKKPLGASVGGVMTFSVQYCTAYEYDYGGYLNTVYCQDEQADGSLASVTGVYAREGSAPAGNQTGPWAPAFWLYSAGGERLATRPGSTGGFMPGTTFYGVDGFDNLPMENWYELSVTADLDPTSNTHNRVLQVSTRNITAGTPADVIDMPQVMWDDPTDDPDMGPLLTDLYIGGGADSTYIPDSLGVYNVGWGTVAAYDNITLTGDVQAIPEPSTALMLLAGFALLPICRRRRW